MRKTILSVLLLAAAGPGAVFGLEPEISPQNAQAAELSPVKDRLTTSLFFRGELADMIIAAGMAGRLEDPGGMETNAGARSALLGWIRKNPAEAAALYLHLRGGGGPPPGAMQSYKITWEVNPVFLSLIKDLNAAAGGLAVSCETMELAARRLYEGPQAQGEGAAPVPGAAPGGSGLFTLNYADYRLNRAGLEREIAAAGAWLEAARGPSGGGPAGLEKEYRAALAEYGAFVVAAAAVKGRAVISGGESRGLEAGRAALRARLASLALRSRAADLAAISGLLAGYGPEPGNTALRAEITAMKVRFEGAAEKIEAGGVSLGGLGRLARGAEQEFSALYLRYSAYNGLLVLKKRAETAVFSCFYDYVIYRYLSAFFPASSYPAARAGLAAEAAALEPALAAAAAGDVPGALSGLGGRTAAIGEAERLVRGASAFNRAAQFFLWGLLFRPVEYGVSVESGRARFRPEATFFSIMADY